MKRKILSLALVLMMVISMIPMGAFATSYSTTGASQFTSVVAVDKTSVTADASSYSEMTIYTYNATNGIAGNTDVYVASSRGTTDQVITGDSTLYPVTGYNSSNAVSTTASAIYVTKVTTDANGKAVVRLLTGATGTAKYGVFLAAPGESAGSATITSTDYQRVLSGITDNNYNTTNFKLIASKDINFQADSAGHFDINNTATSSSSQSFGAVVDSTTNPQTRTFGDKASDGTTNVAVANLLKANGSDYYKVSFRLLTGSSLNSGAPVAGQTVTFDSSDSAVTFDNNSVTTDAAGVATVKVYSTKNGVFTINAKSGSINSEKVLKVALKFAANGVNDIKLATDDKPVLAKDELKKFKFRLYDSQGNQLKLYDDNALTSAQLLDKYKVTYSVEKEPSSSDIGPSLASSVGVDTNDRLVFKATPKYEGDYVIRVKLDNGKKADFNFSVKKQGDVKKLDFYFDEQIVPIGKSATSITLDRLDANGVRTDATGSLNDFYFTSSDSSIATISKVTASSGDYEKVTFYPGTNDENVGKTVVITATDKVNKIAADYKFTVGGKVATIAAKVPADAKTNTDVPLTVNFMDKNGKATSFAFGANDTLETDFIVISKPEGAIVGNSVTAGAFTSDIQTTGGTWKVSSNKPGEVKAQLIVKYTDKDASPNVTYTYTTIATINFGASATTTTANKTIVLTVGNALAVANGTPVSLDLAPFIKDGRAFVPVSFVTAQLGGKAEFTKKADGTVDTVTVTVGDTVATIKIGDTSIKVVKAGKETTVTSDAAAYIKAGRTVLPFRALADAVGAKATYGMKADNSGVEWVKFEQ